MATFVYPSVQDFKDYFFRDFPYGTDIETQVTDPDIAKAFQMANINFNQCFWGDQSSFNVGYFLLSAHYLVMNLRTSSQGINGQFGFLENSKAVGSVSQGFAIPQRILDNPEFSVLMKTNYGAEYMALILPQLCGQVFPVAGRTLP
jgi:hypothetical protein